MEIFGDNVPCFYTDEFKNRYCERTLHGSYYIDANIISHTLSPIVRIYGIEYDQIITYIQIRLHTTAYVKIIRDAFKCNVLTYKYNSYEIQMGLHKYVFKYDNRNGIKIDDPKFAILETCILDGYKVDPLWNDRINVLHYITDESFNDDEKFLRAIESAYGKSIDISKLLLHYDKFIWNYPYSIYDILDSCGINWYMKGGRLYI